VRCEGNWGRGWILHPCEEGHGTDFGVLVEEEQGLEWILRT
jgi:hypothetical protein